MRRPEFLLAVILKLSAAIVLLSIPTIFMPEEWMDRIHQALGLGELPRVAIVRYLTRSLSTMYALLGAITWSISMDVRRYAPLIALWCYLHVAAGSILILIDYWAAMPAFWTISEGPPLIVLGAIGLWLLKKMRES